MVWYVVQGVGLELTGDGVTALSTQELPTKEYKYSERVTGDSLKMMFGKFSITPIQGDSLIKRSLVLCCSIKY